MIVSIHQPEHLPWMGLIHKISISDIYVILDNVQFKKNYFENRNRIYTNQGCKWLAIPVKLQGHIDKKFHEMEAVDGWKKKYVSTLVQNYSKAPYKRDIQRIIEFVTSFEGNNLADLNIGILKAICDSLEIKTQFVRAKDMELSGSKTDLLINILRNLNASSYIVGKSGLDYMELDKFELHNIKLLMHKFKHPNYIPFNFPEITDFPSIIDVIANVGTQKVREEIINNDN